MSPPHHVTRAAVLGAKLSGRESSHLTRFTQDRVPRAQQMADGAQHLAFCLSHIQVVPPRLGHGLWSLPPLYLFPRHWEWPTSDSDVCVCVGGTTKPSEADELGAKASGLCSHSPAQNQPSSIQLEPARVQGPTEVFDLESPFRFTDLSKLLPGYALTR